MEQNNSLVRYITGSLFAAWELVKLNPKAMDYFDVSVTGFWKSFWAIGLTVPMLMLWVYNISDDLPEEAQLAAITVANLVEMIFHLPFFALIMILFTKFIRIDAFYIPMVIAYNWLFVLIFYSIIPLGIIIKNGLIPETFGSIILFSLVFYLQFYVVWFTFKNALRISGYLAIGVLVFELLFSASVMTVFFRAYLFLYS